MRIAIFGTGGVGGYFGGRLAQAGHDVTFIARGKHLAAIKKNGLRVESILGDFIVKPVQATDNPGQVGQVDIILVAVKAWDVPSAAEAIQPMLGENTLVIPLENGVEAPGQLSSVLGKAHVLGGLCRISAFISAPGVIKHVGVPPYIAFGELDNALSQRVKELVDVFAHLDGVSVDVPKDIHKAMWEKFVFIAAVSGAGAVTRQPIGVVRSLPESRAMLLHAMEEVVTVGRACGIDLDRDTAGRVMSSIVDRAPEGTIPSMQKDLMEGKRSELEEQTGAVVRLGREKGIPTPVNEFIYASLLPLEQAALAKSNL
jgi:2-dehydropantoate 2-reductase